MINYSGNVYVLGSSDKGISGLGRRRDDIIEPILIEQFKNDIINDV